MKTKEDKREYKLSIELTKDGDLEVQFSGTIEMISNMLFSAANKSDDISMCIVMAAASIVEADLEKQD